MTGSLLPFYSFDSGAIINGRRDLFRPRTFGAVWVKIEELISLGQIRAVDEVKREVVRKDDEAATWAKMQRSLFVPLSVEIQIVTREVLAAHPRLLGIGGGTRNAADPFVIALAKAHDGTVVTQEQPRNLNKPRIPDVCEAIGVPWQTLPEFVDSQGWSFT